MTETNLCRADPKLFEAAQRRIEALMEKDSYPRFLQSDVFQRLLQQRQAADNSLRVTWWSWWRHRLVTCVNGRELRVLTKRIFKFWNSNRLAVSPTSGYRGWWKSRILGCVRLCTVNCVVHDEIARQNWPIGVEDFLCTAPKCGYFSCTLSELDMWSYLVQFSPCYVIEARHVCPPLRRGRRESSRRRSGSFVGSGKWTCMGDGAALIISILSILR